LIQVLSGIGAILVFTRISSLVPNPEDLLALEVEELAGVLLVHLNSYGEGGGNSVAQWGKIHHYNFFNDLNHSPEYPGRQEAVNAALMEAWSWLQGESLLVAISDGRFHISRRAKRLRSLEEFGAYRKASLLPKGQLHPLIATKVYPAFLRGEYDTAVFQAFRELEVAVRNAGEFSPEDLGTALMREAFRPVDPNKPLISPGPLTDTALPSAEQQAMAHLFSGAIGLYKNPQSHRNVPTEAIDAAEVIVFASHLLRIVDRLSKAARSS
jgi:uncharacterized protein (TIGR02391 family)